MTAYKIEVGTYHPIGRMTAFYDTAADDGSLTLGDGANARETLQESMSTNQDT
jgi:hypothetical protein